MESESLTVYYFLLPLLILLSALFSASETAFFSLNVLRLERLAAEGNKRAQEILHFLQRPAELIATILIGNEMVNVAIASVSAVLFVKLFGEDRGAALSVPITVIVLLIFGEVTPKTLAIKYNERYAFLVFPFLKFVSKLIAPFRKLLVGFASFVLKPFGVELFSKPKVITDEEFMILVSEGAKEGTIEAEEVKLIDKTLDLGEMDVREVMVPKHRVFALPEDMKVGEALKVLKSVKFSRIPIYRGSLDQITGILYTRRILPLTLKPEDFDRPIKDFADEPFFVTEFLTLDELLDQMQKTRRHMAIVVDEYGNTAGIVTLDDILREIVGELPDEKNGKSCEEVERLSERTYRFSGDTPVEELKEILELSDDEVLNEVDTVSGLIMALLKRIPNEGDSVDYQGYRFTVEKKKGNRIESVVVERVE